MISSDIQIWDACNAKAQRGTHNVRHSITDVKRDVCASS